MEFTIGRNDYIKLKLYNQVVTEKTARLYIYLEIDDAEKDYMTVRNAEGLPFRLNNFSIFEDVTEGTVTFRPVVVGCLAYFRMETESPVEISIIRNGSAEVEKAETFGPGELKLLLEPEGAMKYAARVEKIRSEGSELLQQTAAVKEEIAVKARDLEEERQKLEALKAQVAELESQKAGLLTEGDDLRARLAALQQESQKDYEAAAAEQEEIKATFEIDEKLLEMYGDVKVTPIEELLAQAKESLEKLETQIKAFVEAKQRKTAQIESEIKAGKK